MIQTVPSILDRFNPRRVVFQSSEMATVDPVATSTAGTGAAVTFVSVLASIGSQTNRYGIASLATGTTTTGRANVLTPTLDQIVPGFGRIAFSAIVRTPASLSDGTNRYGIKVGLGTLSGSIVDATGASFRYRDNINSGKWQLMTTDSGSTQTFTDSGVTVAADTWYRFEIFVNANATQIQYYLNGTLVATDTATLQSGSSITLGAQVMLLKSLGTTSRICYVDEMSFSMEVDR